MEPVQHIPTDDDIAKVKDAIAKAAQLEGKPTRPVFKKTFSNGKVCFLYTWMTYDKYDKIVSDKMYLQALEKDPAQAQKFVQLQVLQECVLWPPTFNPAAREELQPYPAGVVGTLTDAIMLASGFTQDVAPDSVIVAPPKPDDITEEEVTALINEHPIASSFGVAFEKPFFVRDFNFDSGEYEPLTTRYYIYTQVNRETYSKAKEMQNDEEALLFVLNSCVLWPKNVDWGKEPANYLEWLFKSIMVQSGFGGDPMDGVEEV